MAASSNYLRLGDVVPDFEGETTNGPVKFHEFIGADGWAIFTSHPASLTPICTLEQSTLANLADDFAKRNVSVLSLSVDPLEKHQKWIADINTLSNKEFKFGLVADGDRRIANLWGMIHPNADDTLSGQLTVRTVFFIGPGHKLRASITYPAAVGRSFTEILRVIDALQACDKYRIATPPDWNVGDEVVVQPSVSDEEAEKLFPKGVKKVLPYLRTTPYPDDA
jgi:thioredoxin-dependent peroxiredoxin